MHNLMAMLTFSVLDQKHPFWTNWSKKSNLLVYAETFILTSSIMHKSMVLFSCSVLDRKHPFWANLVQEIKLVSLS